MCEHVSNTNVFAHTKPVVGVRGNTEIHVHQPLQKSAEICRTQKTASHAVNNLPGTSPS